VILLDPATCSEGGCRYERLPGFPVWSPDGQHALAADFDDLVYRKAAGDTSWQALEVGRSPFWLDGETYGFITGNSGASGNSGVGTSAIQLGNIFQSETQQWLTVDDLRAAVPEENFAFQLSRAMSHPFRPGTLLVLANDVSVQRHYLFAVQRGDRNVPWLEGDPTITLLDTVEGNRVVSSFLEPASPQGRWLALQMEDSLILYDLKEEEVALVSHHLWSDFLVWPRWSADEKWLALSRPGILDLVVLGSAAGGKPYRHLVFHDRGRCVSTAWIDGGE
jgi:hypothetical protein